MAVNVKTRLSSLNSTFKRNYLAGLFCFLLLLTFGTARGEGQPGEKAILVNRAVLTVGREIYTAADAVGMLVAWNLTRGPDEKPVVLSIDWLKDLPVGDSAGAEVIMMMKTWPEELKLFFQSALIWLDVQKLNLFVQREQDIAQNLKKMNDLSKEAFGSIPEPLLKEVQSASQQTKKKWVESVMRIRSFIRVRGSLERNRNLFSVGWYWHKPPVMDSKKK
ncbi:MAG: hypothetical protein RI953_152 [Pseudomonadota bacterium]|jgi:hypothetical protein